MICLLIQINKYDMIKNNANQENPEGFVTAPGKIHF